MLRPALALDPWMDTEDINNRRAISDLLDTPLTISPVSQASPSRISSVYVEILRQGQWARSTLYPDQRRQLAAAGKVLFSDPSHSVPTPGYKNYLTLKQRVDALQAAWDVAAPADRTATMASNLEEAKNDLDIFDSNTPTYITAAADYQSLTKPPPTDMRDRLLQNYVSSLGTSNGSTFAPSDFKSGYQTALMTDKWTTLQINEAATGGIPLTGIWGSQQGDTAAPLGFSDSHATSASVSFEYALVPIVRPWFDISVFSDRSWRWADGAHQLVSDGLTANGGPHGLLPSVPLVAVVARNVLISTDLPPSEWALIQRAVLDGRTLVWGPFLVSGRYVDPQHRALAPWRTGNTLHIGGPQIIGWMTEVLDLSPNPDPQFDWGTAPGLLPQK